MKKITRASGGALWEKLKPKARQMRHAPTPAEEALWGHLRNRKLGGFKFRRQHAIGRFVVDFYCAERNLVVELDGAVHDTNREQDGARDSVLRELGLKVIRFENQEVLAAPGQALQTILKEMERNQAEGIAGKKRIFIPPYPRPSALPLSIEMERGLGGEAGKK